MFHFAIVSNSTSRRFSIGSSLHLAPLPLFRSPRSSICKLCVFQVMRVSGLPRFVVRAAECVPLGACRACDPKKGSQFAARLVARYRRGQFYNNKNFVLKQIFICLSIWNVYILCRKSEIFIFVSFVLYVYRKIFSLLLFKIFW